MWCHVWVKYCLSKVKYILPQNALIIVPMYSVKQRKPDGSLITKVKFGSPAKFGKYCQNLFALILMHKHNSLGVSYDKLVSRHRAAQRMVSSLCSSVNKEGRMFFIFHNNTIMAIIITQ